MTDTETPRPKSYLMFDGMTWPNPDDPRELAWKLTYGNPTREELIGAVSYIGAYRQLVEDTQAVRNGKVTRIRAARDAEQERVYGEAAR